MTDKLNYAASLSFNYSYHIRFWPNCPIKYKVCQMGNQFNSHIAISLSYLYLINICHFTHNNLTYYQISKFADFAKPYFCSFLDYQIECTLHLPILHLTIYSDNQSPRNKRIRSHVTIILLQLNIFQRVAFVVKPRSEYRESQVIAQSIKHIMSKYKSGQDLLHSLLLSRNRSGVNIKFNEKVLLKSYDMVYLFCLVFCLS